MTLVARHFIFALALCATVAAARTVVTAQTQGGGFLGGVAPPEPPPDAGARPAGEAASAPATTGGPTVIAPRISTPPNLDGLLDDEAWSQAARVTEFVQRSPVEGAPASESTEVFIAYDSANLYFGFYAHYSNPEIMRASRSDRDQLGQDDTISIYFDPFLDQQRAFVFSVNGYGVQGDSIMGAGGGGGGGFGGGGGGPGGGGGGPGGGGGGPGLPRGDSSWDALFEAAGSLVSDGWMAEVAIPFKSLRYPARGGGEDHRWGFQIARTIQSKNESDVWAPLSRAISGFLTQMGTLQGLTNLSTSRNLEILPTFTAIQLGALNQATGEFDEDAVDPEAGVNVKYGVTSDLIADFTFNPDFSQIESDQPQIEVNLRFPLFFPELRPFFLEGREVFDTLGAVNLVHTRTIIDPRYGGKLTGKLGDLAVGLLVANDEAPGKLDDAGDPAFERTAQFFIGRLRWDLAPGSYVGGLVTDREFLDSHSRVGGIDGRFRLGRTDDLQFRVAQSWNQDAAGERSAATYDVSLRHNGRNLDYNLDHEAVEPGFATATGFVRRTDMRRTHGRVGYRFWPESWMLNWGPDLIYERNYDFAGVLQDEGVGVGTSVQFARNIRVNLGADREMERFGDIDFWKWRHRIFASVGTSRRVSFGGGFFGGDQIRYSATPFLGESTGARLFVNVQPSSRLRSALNLDYSGLDDPRDGSEVFSVTIVRSLTTYQFTGRLLARNIVEYNTFTRKFNANVLLTYRVNAGTVFFVGYDDTYQQGDQLGTRFAADRLQRTRRAFFTKLSYLFRY